MEAHEKILKQCTMQYTLMQRDLYITQATSIVTRMPQMTYTPKLAQQFITKYPLLVPDTRMAGFSSLAVSLISSSSSHLPATISCIFLLRDLDPFGHTALLACCSNNTQVSDVIQQAVLQQDLHPPAQSSHILTNKPKTNSLIIRVHVRINPYLLRLDLGS